MECGSDSDQFNGQFASDGSDFGDSDLESHHSFFSDDDSMFSLESIEESELRDIRNGWNAMPTAVEGLGAVENHSENDPILTENMDEDSISSDEENEAEIVKGKSILHKYLFNKVVYFSFDIETGGEYCGIVQISCQKFQLTQHNNEISVEKEARTFNKYVKPPPDAIWDENMCNRVHKLHKDDPRIESADDITSVWKQFCDFINCNVGASQKGVLVAWNGATCDMRWIYKLCQAPFSRFNLPSRLKYFLDPMGVIRYYKSCKLNKAESLELGAVWSHIKNANLNNAHDSLVDVIAQTDIVTHPEFLKYIDKKQTYRTIRNIFSASDQSAMKKKMEASRPVHEPWVELDEESESWRPPLSDSYTGYAAGSSWGPSNLIIDTAKKTKYLPLAVLFLILFPFKVIEWIAKETNYYTYDEWVKLVDRFDRDGKIMKKKGFVRCKKTDAGSRNRADNEGIKFKITPGYVLAWLAILIYHGAKNSGNPLLYWMEEPDGETCPPIQNTMSRNAFEFMRRYIHFERNSKGRNKNDPKFDPLFKIRFVLRKVMQGIRKGWQAGKGITIDESMIKYMGKAISFVQYMPLKPIKHGIKVFAMCCAYSAYLLGFEVYLGKEFTRDGGSALNVVDRLIVEGDLHRNRGRVLYSDNWYTSVDLAKHLYDKYGWTIVGTITPTEKKARGDHDVPYLKLSNGALKLVHRGWYREAVVTIKSKKGRKYKIQCTTWRDKKQVMFLHTALVGPSRGSDTAVKRHVKGRSQRVDLQAPKIQHEYAKHFNAVDRNDRDSADYSCSIRTTRWYLRIFLWQLDRVVLSLFIIVCFLNAHGIGDPSWKRFRDRHLGRRRFQIALALALIQYAIELDWEDPFDEKKKPRWMRQTQYIPCGCKRCFFCLRGKTKGVHHDRSHIVTTSPNSQKRKKIQTQCTKKRMELKRLKRYTEYCVQCCNSQDKSIPHKIRRKRSNKTYLGCPSCDEPICKVCWEDYTNPLHKP